MIVFIISHNIEKSIEDWKVIKYRFDQMKG